jgi:hypothetical protein
MSNAASGRVPAHLDAHKLWRLLDLASLALLHLESGLEALTLVSTSEHIDCETRRAVDFIRIGLNHQAGDINESLESAIKIVAKVRGPMPSDGAEGSA